MLTICTWWWGEKYPEHYVVRLVRGLKRGMQRDFRMIVITDRHQLAIEGAQRIAIDPFDYPLLKIKGCLVRLRMFDKAWQQQHNIRGRLACVDLDTVITGPLDPVFDRSESFVILQGANASNPCPYTGALMMLQTGTEAHYAVWRDFDLAALDRIPRYEFADDQGWLAHKLPNAAGWRAGEGGVYAFMKPGWPHKHGALPADARIVTFPGHRDPAQFQSLEWVRRHWQ